MARQGRLDRRVLKNVSRSFYLSLRFLPAPFREPASLGYLLARASDTIADAGEGTGEARREALARYQRWVHEGGSFDLPNLVGLSRGEGVLMSCLPECGEALAELPGWQQAAVRRVVSIITDGQTWDLERFAGEGVVSLSNDDELKKYAYQVAGCVGEFWTEIGQGVDPHFATKMNSEMMALGRHFGEGLQLINILRDLGEDWERGRCYLPGVTGIKELWVERQRWLVQARQRLEAGVEYARALRGNRLRFATLLPALIGHETLDLLELVQQGEWTKRVKISRSKVRHLMFKAVKFALAD